MAKINAGLPRHRARGSEAAPGRTVSTIRRDITLLVIGSVLTLSASAITTMLQTARSNAEQRYHKRIDALRDFTLQTEKMFNNIESALHRQEQVLQRAEKALQRSGAVSTEDANSLTSLAVEFEGFNREAKSQLVTATRMLELYFGVDAVRHATPEATENAVDASNTFELAAHENLARIEGSRTSSERAAATSQGIALIRKASSDIRRALEAERQRAHILATQLAERL